MDNFNFDNSNNLTNGSYHNGGYYIKRASFKETLSFNCVAVAELLLGIPAELLIMYLILTTDELRKGCNFVLFNLLFSEMLTFCCVGVISPITRLYNLDMLCKLTGLITYLSFLSAWLSFSLMTVDRYVGLFYSDVFEKYFSNRRVFLMISGIWISPLVLLIPFIATDSLGFEELQICGVIFGDSLWKVLYDTVILHGCFIISTYSLALYLNLKIYRKLHQHKADMRHLRLQSQVVKEFKSISNMLICYGLLPLFLQFPGAIGKEFSFMIRNIPWLAHVLQLLYMSNLAASPYIVLVCLKPFRSACLSLLCRRNRNEVVEFKNFASTASRRPTLVKSNKTSPKLDE